MSRAYLLDTNVVSEMRKREPNAAVMRFVAGQDDDCLFVSGLSIGELSRGEALKRKSDPVAADALRSWIEGTEERFADRILGVNTDVAKLWGMWSAQRSRAVVDTLLAATAAVHGLTLVTRNVADVRDLPVDILNPWRDL